MDPRCLSICKPHFIESAGWYLRSIICLNHTKIFSFQMLGQFWLFAILASLALGVPVSRESDTSSLTLVDLSNTKVSYGPKKMGLNKANEAVWDLKGKARVRVGSKAVSNDLGTSSLSSYSASSSGSSGVSSNSTSSGTSDGPKKLGLNKANNPSWNLKHGGGNKTTLQDKGMAAASGSLAYSTGVSGALGGI